MQWEFTTPRVCGGRGVHTVCPNMEGFWFIPGKPWHSTAHPSARNVAIPEPSLTEHHAHSVRKGPEVACASGALGRLLALPATADPAVQGGLFPYRPGQRRSGRGARPEGHVC